MNLAFLSLIALFALSETSFAQVRTTTLECVSKSAKVNLIKSVDYSTQNINLKMIVSVTGCIDGQCGTIQSDSEFDKLNPQQADPRSMQSNISVRDEKILIQYFSYIKGLENIPGIFINTFLKTSNPNFKYLSLRGNLLETSPKTFMKANLYVSNGQQEAFLGAETLSCSYLIKDNGILKR